MSGINLNQATPEQAARYALNVYNSNNRAGVRTTGEMFIAALEAVGWTITPKGESPWTAQSAISLRLGW